MILVPYDRRVYGSDAGPGTVHEVFSKIDSLLSQYFRSAELR
jgi:hypothetical protein